MTSYLPSGYYPLTRGRTKHLTGLTITAIDVDPYDAGGHGKGHQIHRIHLSDGTRIVLQAFETGDEPVVEAAVDRRHRPRPTRRRRQQVLQAIRSAAGGEVLP